MFLHSAEEPWRLPPRGGTGGRGGDVPANHQFHPRRVRVGLAESFFKKARSAGNRISCHPTALHPMRNHFVPSAPKVTHSPLQIEPLVAGLETGDNHLRDCGASPQHGQAASPPSLRPSRHPFRCVSHSTALVQFFSLPEAGSAALASALPFLGFALLFTCMLKKEPRVSGSQVPACVGHLRGGDRRRAVRHSRAPPEPSPAGSRRSQAGGSCSSGRPGFIATTRDEPGGTLRGRRASRRLNGGR